MRIKKVLNNFSQKLRIDEIFIIIAKRLTKHKVKWQQQMLKAGVWAATAKATDAGEMHKQKKIKCLILTFELKK